MIAMQTIKQVASNTTLRDYIRNSKNGDQIMQLVCKNKPNSATERASTSGMFAQNPVPTNPVPTIELEDKAQL